MSTLKVDTVRPVTTDGSLTLQGDASGAGVTGITIDSNGVPDFPNGQIVAAGAEATPSITPTSDPNTGIYFPAADTVGVSTGGSERLRIDSIGNVGIGISPTQKLEVAGSIRAKKSSNTRYELFNDSDPIDPNDYWIIEHNDAGSLKIMRRDDSASTWGSNLILEANGEVNLSNNKMLIDSSGNLKFNSGYGSAAIAYGCRAWVNFDGTFGTSPFTVANGGIRASGNVTSVTDNGTGFYTVNFTNAMPDVNYSAVASGGDVPATHYGGHVAVKAFATGSFDVLCSIPNAIGLNDLTIVTASVFR